jgi:hypothetical protein
MEAKQLLVRDGPPEPALAVGDEAVHRNAHRVDQQGFEVGASERRTMVVIRFIIELGIGLLFPLKFAPPKLETDRNARTHLHGRSKQPYPRVRAMRVRPGSGRETRGTGKAGVWKLGRGG